MKSLHKGAHNARQCDNGHAASPCPPQGLCAGRDSGPRGQDVINDNNPLTGDSRRGPRWHAKHPGDILQPRPRRDHRPLALGRPFADQHIGPNRNRRTRRNPMGKQARLIELAHEQPPPVEWDRHHQVGLLKFGPRHGQHPADEQGAGLLTIGVLETKDKVSTAIVIRDG